jgi:ubiquitin carboxyl-terminal hydrolase L3
MDNSNQNDWQPLESNPQVINKFMYDLGFDTKKYVFHEMLSIEEWGIGMVPFPVQGAIFLYPNNEQHYKHKRGLIEKMKTDNVPQNKNLFFMKQSARNACGTIAVVHTLINLGREDRDLIRPDTYLDGFFKEVKKTTCPVETGKIFSQSTEIRTAHTAAVQQGQTRVEAERWDYHFVAFFEKDGNLYELDGTLEFPINHGECTREEILFKSCQIVQEYMARDPNELKFTLMPLAPPEDPANA